MKAKQAKDFLVQQTAEQASRESVPLSETEKKMMYFTESDATSCDNPVQLNEEFEAQYDTAEYETKISRLLHHAYDRLRLEDPEGNVLGTKRFARFAKATITFSYCGISNPGVSIRHAIFSNSWELGCS